RRPRDAHVRADLLQRDVAAGADRAASVPGDGIARVDEDRRRRFEEGPVVDAGTDRRRDDERNRANEARDATLHGSSPSTTPSSSGEANTLRAIPADGRRPVSTI